MEVLCTYVRINAPAVEEQPDQNSAPVASQKSPNKPTTAQEQRPRADVLAILTVLGRRNASYERSDQALDLSETNLGGADLHERHLERADLTSVHLEGEMSSLAFSHLENADLTSAYLRKAILRGAYLNGANFKDAQLDEAKLDLAHLDNLATPSTTLLLYLHEIEGVFLLELGFGFPPIPWPGFFCCWQLRGLCPTPQFC